MARPGGLREARCSRSEGSCRKNLQSLVKQAAEQRIVPAVEIHRVPLVLGAVVLGGDVGAADQPPPCRNSSIMIMYQASLIARLVLHSPAVLNSLTRLHSNAIIPRCCRPVPNVPLCTRRFQGPKVETGVKPERGSCYFPLPGGAETSLSLHQPRAEPLQVGADLLPQSLLAGGLAARTGDQPAHRNQQATLNFV